MKIFKLILLIFIIASCSKDDENHFISNPLFSASDLTIDQYTSLFYCKNCGENKYEVELSWNEYTGDDFVSYVITNSVDQIIETINSQNITTTIIDNANIGLNEIKTLKLKLADTQKGYTKVFTRPVSPVSNIVAQGPYNSKTISWTSSADNDIIGNGVILYKTNSSLFNGPRPFINDTNGEPDPIWTKLDEGSDEVFETYTDTDINSQYEYYYIVKVIDSNGGYRYSHVASSIEGSMENGIVDLGDLETNSIGGSTEYTYFIWTGYGNNDFHELQIHRGEEDNFDIDDNTLVFKTDDPTLNSFQDYTINNEYGYADGKTWYYKIRFYNIYGNYADSNTITCQTD